MGATRDIALNELPIRGISINPASTGGAAITVVPSDSGTLFINKYAATTTYTLPAVADGAGKWFWFFGGIANNIVVYGPAATTVYGPAALGRTFTGTGAIGIACMVVGDGDYYYAFALNGTWAIS
jgi:hypothetical protein